MDIVEGIKDIIGNNELNQISAEMRAIITDSSLEYPDKEDQLAQYAIEHIEENPHSPFKLVFQRTELGMRVFINNTDITVTQDEKRAPCYVAFAFPDLISRHHRITLSHVPQISEAVITEAISLRKLNVEEDVFFEDTVTVLQSILQRGVRGDINELQNYLNARRENTWLDFIKEDKEGELIAQEVLTGTGGSDDEEVVPNMSTPKDSLRDIIESNMAPNQKIQEIALYAGHHCFETGNRESSFVITSAELKQGILEPTVHLHIDRKYPQSPSILLKLSNNKSEVGITIFDRSEIGTEYSGGRKLAYCFVEEDRSKLFADIQKVVKKLVDEGLAVWEQIDVDPEVLKMLKDSFPQVSGIITDKEQRVLYNARSEAILKRSVPSQKEIDLRNYEGISGEELEEYLRDLNNDSAKRKRTELVQQLDLELIDGIGPGNHYSSSPNAYLPHVPAAEHYANVLQKLIERTLFEIYANETQRPQLLEEYELISNDHRDLKEFKDTDIFLPGIEHLLYQNKLHLSKNIYVVWRRKKIDNL